MKVAKAIEILQVHWVALRMLSDTDYADALQLGIGALKRLQELRRYPDHNPQWKIPGEDPELKKGGNYGNRS